MVLLCNAESYLKTSELCIAGSQHEVGDENTSLRYNGYPQARYNVSKKPGLSRLLASCKTLAIQPPIAQTPFSARIRANLLPFGRIRGAVLLPHKFPRPKRQQETLFGAAGGTQAYRAKQLNELDAAPGLRVPALVCY